MRKILIAVPCMDQMPAQFAHSLATLTSYGVENAEVSIWFQIGSLIYSSRDEIAKKALLIASSICVFTNDHITVEVV